jgi:demethoxyubiquinone hydroxylase (CLK1/Coq7/Cat5 family)
MNAQLVIENQTLQHENRHLTILLKDHETTLEQIMNRFRNHAVKHPSYIYISTDSDQNPSILTASINSIQLNSTN